MQKWRIYFLFFGILFSRPAWAQIEAVKGLEVQFGGDEPQLSTSFQPSVGGAPILKFQPNVPTKTFLGMGYGPFGASVGWVGVQDPTTANQFGSTNSSDYQFRLYLRKINIESFIQNYQGYYLYNTGDAVAGYNSNSPRLLYPNMQSQHYGVVVTYKFSSEQFSSSAAFDQYERQLSSGGSWLVNASIDYFNFSNNATFVPAGLTGQYNGFQNVYGGNILTYSQGFGYGYNWVLLQRWFLAAQAMVNIGPSYENYNYSGNITASNSGFNGAQTHGKLALGYNGEKFCASARVSLDSVSAPFPGVSVSYSATELSFYLGYRWTDFDIPWLDVNFF